MSEPLLALLQLAADRLRARDVRQAADIYQKILSKNPNQREALAGLGTVHYAAGDYPRAVTLLAQAAKIGDFSPEIHVNLGMALLAVGQLDAALGEMQAVVDRHPDMASARLGCATALRAKGQIAGAIEHMRHAVRLHPQASIAVQLADLLDIGGRRREAIEVFQRAVAGITPPVDWLCRLAEMLLADHQCDAALETYRQAVEIAPENAAVRALLANALSYQREFDEGIAQLRRAVDLAPQDPAIRSALLMALLHHKDTQPRDFLTEAKTWSARHVKRPPTPPRYENTRDPDRPLRVGYLSTFFRFSAEAHYLLPILQHHDTANVEVFCYPTGNISDSVTERLRRASKNWRPLHGVDDAAAHDLIRADQIDILVTLDNHLQDNRLPLLTRKPAPICVTWLLSAATTGCDAIDYRRS